MFKICFALYVSILSPEPATTSCRIGDNDLMRFMVIACMEENRSPFSMCRMTAVPGEAFPRYYFTFTKINGA